MQPQKNKASAPQTKSFSLVDALLVDQPSVTPELEDVVATWEEKGRTYRTGNRGVSFSNFYALCNELKDKGGRVLRVPPHILKNALLTIHDEPNGYISYGFEDKTTRREIDFVLYEDQNNPYFPENHKVVVENEDLYPGEGPVTVIETGYRGVR